MASPTRAVDVHAHAVPAAAIDAIRRDGRRYGGVEVSDGDRGPVITFPGQSPLRPVAPKLLDFRERIAWLDERSLQRQLVSPWLEVQGQTLEPEAGARWAMTLNDAFARAVSDAPDRLTALATVPLRDGQGAARELERAVKTLGLPGAMLSTDPAPADLLDPSLEELWAAAAELRVPLVLHPPRLGPSGCNPTVRQFGNVYGRTIDTTLVAARLVLAGVFDRHPALPIVLVHGGGFLAFQRRRLDACYAAGDLGAKTLAKPAPSEYLASFCYDTVLMSGPALRLLAETVGAERILTGSDYPFPAGDPDPVATVRAAGLDEAATERVLSTNAIDLFALSASSC